jgi:hypothetical protein
VEFRNLTVQSEPNVMNRQGIECGEREVDRGTGGEGCREQTVIAV